MRKIRLIALILITLGFISMVLMNISLLGFSKVETTTSIPTLKTSSERVANNLRDGHSITQSQDSHSVISASEVSINTISPWGATQPSDEARLKSALQVEKTKERLLANRLSQLEHLMTQALSEQDSFKYQEEWTRLKHAQLELPMPSANPYWSSFQEAKTPINSATETNAKAQ